MSFYSSGIFTIIAAFLTLIFALIGFVLALNCIWRSKHQLRKAMMFAMIAMVPVIVRKIALFAGFYQAPWYLTFGQYSDVLAAFFFLLAIGEMYSIIRSLDNER